MYSQVTHLEDMFEAIDNDIRRIYALFVGLDNWFSDVDHSSYLAMSKNESIKSTQLRLINSISNRWYLKETTLKQSIGALNTAVTSLDINSIFEWLKDAKLIIAISLEYYKEGRE